MSDVIIYGTGNEFKDFFEDSNFVKLGIKESEINIIGICDGNREKWGQEVMVERRKYVVQDILRLGHSVADFVLITSRRFYEEIKSDLVKKGINSKKIYLLDEYIRNKLFDENDFKHELSLALIIRNEAEYILEWIEYHRLIGVDHFYIYDDESSDNLYEKIKDYIRKGIVTYIFWPNADQTGAYQNTIQNFRWDSKYIGFIDLDEFIIPVGYRNLIDVIEEIVDNYEQNPLRERYLPHCGGIGINWRMYGTSYHKKRPDGLVTEKYMYRADDDYYENVHIKSIVNPRVVTECGVHSMQFIKGFQCISENGSAIPDSFFFDSKCNKLRINHYYSKSEEDLLKKYCRGWIPERGDGQDITMSEKRMNLYSERLGQIKKGWNRNYDPIMEPYIPALKKRLGYK